MHDAQFKSSQPVSSFTIADLEKLVEEIVDKRLQQKLEAVKPFDSPPPIFLETFGTWEDDLSAEEIIADLYNSRSSRVQA